MSERHSVLSLYAVCNPSEANSSDITANAANLYI